MGDRESRVLDQNFEVEFELGRENVAMLQLPSCFVHRILSAVASPAQPFATFCTFGGHSLNNIIVFIQKILLYRLTTAFLEKYMEIYFN